MRTLLCLAALCAPAPSLADSCGSLAAQVSSATGLEASEREPDFASYTVDPNTMITLACGNQVSSSIGAHHRGAEPPASYFRLLGQAGEVVTGIAADRISVAAQRAFADAPRLKHSNVPTDGLLVTCALTKPRNGDAMAMCAVIAYSDRS